MLAVNENWQRPWAPQPGPQTEAICADWCPEILYGGAVGGGKSDFLLGDYLQDVPTYEQAWRGVMFRRTYPELEELILRSRELYPQTGAEWNEQKKTWHWGNGANLKMRYVESDKDVLRYQGHQYTWIGWDELTQWPTLYPYRYLRSRLRSAHAVPTKRIRAASNPGGPGHIEVKSYFVDPAPQGFVPIRDESTNLERMFIPSRLENNVILTRTDPTYINRVKGLGSENLVKALLEGDWSVIEGAFFDCWSSEKHVIRPFTVPSTWQRFRSMDWGSAKPFSVGWWAIAQDDFTHPDGNKIPRGALVRYREWYGIKMENGKAVPNVGLKLTAEEVAAGIKEREKEDTISYGVLDPAAFSRDGGPSLHERMMLHGDRQRMLTFKPADNKRVSVGGKNQGAIGGWDMMRHRLKGADGTPMIFFFNTCTHTIRTVPVLQHDPNRAEDLDTSAEDHCFAAGTLVETSVGVMPIENLPSAGLVYSSDGELHPYRSARMTRRAAKVVRLRFEDGKSITCTPDHKFLVDSNEWRYASDLIGRSVICSHLSYRTPYRNLAASDTICVGSISRKKAFDFISKFGRITTDLCRTAITSTMRMKIGRTTKAQTWNALRFRSILVNVTARLRQNAAENHLALRGLVQPHGTVLNLGRLGTASISTSTSDTSLKSVSMPFASSAVKPTKPAESKSSRPSSAIRIAKHVRCVAVEEQSETVDVYCLTVPDMGCFALEGGMIVSNCADEIRYACMSRPWFPPAPQPAEPDPMKDYQSNDRQNSGENWKWG